MDNLGAIIGPLLAIALVGLVGVRTVILLSIIPGLLAVAAILYTIRRIAQPAERERQPIRLRVRPVLRGRLGRLLAGVSVFELGNMAATLLILRATVHPNPPCQGTEMHTFRRRPRPSTIIATAALILAPSGTAIAAAPGDPFQLGQTQTIDKASTVLEGTNQLNDGVLSLRKGAGGIGPVLKVTNPPRASADAASTSRSRRARRRSPSNADAGKATNLNADELDGKTEEDFLPSRLYGNATGLLDGPGGGKTKLLTAIQGLDCDTGDVAISAGGNAVDANDALNGITPFRSSYQIEFTDNGDPSKFSANIICADVSKPFR